MKSGGFFWRILAGLSLLVGFLASCVSAGFRREPELPLRPAWRLYREGDFSAAKAAALALLLEEGTKDGGHYLLCLVSHLTGDHAEAISQYGLIRRSYPKRKLLVEPLLWSYIHLGDYAGALRHLESSGIRQAPALLEALAHWKAHPLETEAKGVSVIPFTEDRLSPLMPGIRVRIKGRELIARLDTGGGFLHLSPALAEELGIIAAGREKSFAALSDGDMGYGGFADLELGSAILRNVPVYINDQLTHNSQRLAEAFGEVLGPIIGTNVLQEFLSTIDGPGKRLIISPRQNPDAAQEHAELLSGTAFELPFALWSDHFMIARGMLGEEIPLRLFFDSGLVVANEEEGQAALLASVSALESWGVPIPEGGRFAVLPRALRVGRAEGRELRVYPVPEATWKGMGDWGGLGVDALLSWGFLKNYAWTIDFDRMLFIFRAPPL